MNKMITARHLDLAPGTRDQIFAELGKLARAHPHLQRGETVLDSHRGWCRAEIVLRGRHTAIQARAKARDLQIAVATAIARADRQLRRHRSGTRRSPSALSLPPLELSLQALQVQVN